MDQQGHETANRHARPAPLDPETDALFANWSDTRAELKAARETIVGLERDLATVTARLEEALRTNEQLRADLSASIAREGAAIAIAGQLRGVIEAIQRSAGTVAQVGLAA